MIGWEFPPFASGGLGVHCFELTSRLCEMGVEVDFFMPKSGEGVKSSHPNLRIIEVAKVDVSPYIFVSKSKRHTTYGENLIRAVEQYNKECAQAIVEQAKERGYSIIHAHDWLGVKAACDAAGKTKLPIVHTFHSTEFDRTSVPWDFLVDIERQGVQNANLLIAVSKRTKAQLMRLGADEGKIRVVYNGVDAKKFQEESERNAAAERFKRGRRTVLFFGRLTEQKGPMQFLHAAKKVLQMMPDTLFLVAGKGDMLPLLINTAIELGIKESVMFLGYVSEEDQRKIYSAADVYVMPSTSEPFGITALEAMSAGTPVIISRTSGVGETIKGALLVDFWDINGMAQKMLSVLKYPALGNSLSSAGKEDARKMSWEKAAQDTIAVYNEVTGRGKGT